VYNIVVKKFTFTISSPDEFLVDTAWQLCYPSSVRLIALTVFANNDTKVVIQTNE